MEIDDSCSVFGTFLPSCEFPRVCHISCIHLPYNADVPLSFLKGWCPETNNSFNSQDRPVFIKLEQPENPASFQPFGDMKSSGILLSCTLCYLCSQVAGSESEDRTEEIRKGQNHVHRIESKQDTGFCAIKVDGPHKNHSFSAMHNRTADFQDICRALCILFFLSKNVPRRNMESPNVMCPICRTDASNTPGRQQNKIMSFEVLSSEGA